ncbi:hypothetical protein C6P45_000439 [Maudiozyma exigua]|uniref:Uncharacterized protein n=1 Tax=Maudiozyma exigua TaxID=34358 RepID=A0A9P6W838_MAUEX|nr:hypothetical protein C6P45_000439 [Kazachstania exigua]
MPKHSKAPSFSNIDMTTAGSIVTKSPNEALNKWKIPHYYKKNSSTASSSSYANTPLDNNSDQQHILTSKNNSALSTPDLSHLNKSSNGKFMKSPTFKNLTSPKKMIMHDNDKKQSRSKKNGKNGMVFVNYTIQDDPDKINNDENIISQNNNFIQHDLPNEISQELFNSPNLIASLPQSKQVNSKQKSARKRMMKIFGSSKNKFANMNGLMKDDKENRMDTSSMEANNTISYIPTTRKSVSKPTPLNRSISTPSLNKEEMVMPSNTSSKSSQSRKKSYGSLLKYGKLTNSATSFNNIPVMEDFSFDDMMNEIVPKSNNDNDNVTAVPVSKNRKGGKTPRTSRVASASSIKQKRQQQQQQQQPQSTYSNLSSSYLNDPNMNTNIASMPMFDANMDASKAMEMAMTEQQKFNNFNFQNSNNMPMNNANINHSTPSLHSTNNNTGQLNRMYTSSSSSTHLPINSSGSTNNISPNSNIVGLGISPSSDSPKLKNEENDASIAFSKMVTKKKRASTMDSIPSSRNSMSNGNNMIKPIGSNGANKDINSGLSSMNNIYSPIRTASPARQRSSTRGSSNYRLSRDISSLSSVPDAPENSYLDTQQYNQKVPGTNGNGTIIPTNNSNTRIGHRKKQESISEVYRQQQQIMNNTVSTPSSASVPFITPPYFTSNLAIPSSNSTSSTPSVGDLSTAGLVHGNGMNLSQGMYMNTSNSSFLEGNVSMDNSQNNAIIEMSDIQTPLESNPGIDAVTSTTTPTTQGTPSNLLNKNGKDRRFIRNSNLEHENMPYLPNDTSTSSSSAMESLMTNSLSTSTSHTLNKIPTNASNIVYQNANGEPFTLVNTGIASNDINLNHFNNGKMLGMQRLTNTNGNTNMSDDQLIQQMYMEFDFENPNGFLNDNQRVMSGTAHGDMITESPTMTSIAGATSSTSPSTIVPQNANSSTMTHSQLQNELSNSMMNNDNSITTSNNNNNNTGSMMMMMMNGDELINTFNSTMASGSEIPDISNETNVVDVNNEMTTAFLDN